MTDKERDEQFEVIFSGADEIIPDRLTKTTAVWQSPEKRIYNKRNMEFWAKRKKEKGGDRNP